MSVAIRAKDLSKRYELQGRMAYGTLRDALTRSFHSFYRRARRSSSLERGSAQSIWALKDVSFEVKHGEILGIIGRNGSGKSTLLKILSRITEPTSGHAEVHGQLASLLEVGTGFHPELTGRENVYVNGAILGMRHREIDRKFDEIVAFADIERFIDTPVKRYSSGMQMRLAFAVAAHLEPHILLVDEVLAVGDAQFQRKCLSTMAETAKAGRTVLFVSHQMNQIRKLCTTGLWLESGEVQLNGPVNEVISAYEERFSGRVAAEATRTDQRLSTQFLSWSVEGGASDGDRNTISEDDHALLFEFRLLVVEKVVKGHHGIALFNADNLLVWAYAFDNLALDPGSYDLRYRFPTLPLRPGIYHWDVSLYDDGVLLNRWNAMPPLRVHTPMRTHASDAWQGVLNLKFSMNVQPVDEAVPLSIEQVSGTPVS